MTTFRTKTPTIEATHIEKAGTHEIDGTPIFIEQDDTYVVKTDEDTFVCHTGKLFRYQWEPV